MRRSKFLLGLVSIFPLSGFAGKHLFPDGRKGIKIAAGEGRYNGHMRLQGVNSNVIDLKISGKDTDGALAIFEQTSISPGRGTPLHAHASQDEFFFVMEGNFFFKVGPDEFRLGPGDAIFLPRNVPHSWTQLSKRGKMTVTFQPAGKMEEFFLAVSSLKKTPGATELAQLFINADMKIVGPPVKPE